MSNVFFQEKNFLGACLPWLRACCELQNTPKQTYIRTTYPKLQQWVRSPRPCQLQGRNEIWWRLGQKASLAPPYSNLTSFWSKCTVLKKVLVVLLGLFGARGIVPPCPLVTPLQLYLDEANHSEPGWLMSSNRLKFFCPVRNFRIRLIKCGGALS